MTYYELINFFSDNLDAPRSDKLIEVLNNPVKYTGNTKIRLSNHVVNFISTRLNNHFNAFYIKLNKDLITKETIVMEISELKREITYVSIILNTPILKDIKEQLRESILDFIVSFEDKLKESYKDINDTELLNIIDNLNLKEGI